MNDPWNSWNLPWQALQRKLATEPRAASASVAWRARARMRMPWPAGAPACLDLSPGRPAK